MTTSPASGIETPAAAKYQRTVITTTRRKAPEPTPPKLVISKADVQALSKALKDSTWYARQRLAAWKTFQSLPTPGLTDEAWRRTDIRTFKWDEAPLPFPAAQAGKPVPGSLLKPLV